MESFLQIQKKEKSVQIPQFPKLYQFNNNHKIYQWSVRIEQSSGDSYDIITEHGEKDGNLVPHIKNIDKGKAKRSVLQQAILEAESKWKNKKEKDLYCETVSMTEQNAEETTIVRPMLANTFSFDAYQKGGRGFKISFPAYVQQKLDGIRCISYMKDGQVVLESRKGIAFQNFEMLRNQLRDVFAQLPNTMYLDGELYTDRVDFETLSGMVRLTEKKLKVGDRERINQVEYHVYDFVDTARLGLTYQQRHEMIDTLFQRHGDKSLLKKVPTHIATKLEDVKTMHDTFVQQGYEGIMIREMSGVYEVQKRSKFLQKYKEFFEEEFKIVGFHEGTGDMKGCVIWDCENKEGKIFAVVPKGTFDTKREYYQNGAKYVNKLLTVIYQELTADGIPRFPIGKGIRDIF
jgi:ATP-dependent DNA ligase